MLTTLEALEAAQRHEVALLSDQIAAGANHAVLADLGYAEAAIDEAETRVTRAQEDRDPAQAPEPDFAVRNRNLGYALSALDVRNKGAYLANVKPSDEDLASHIRKLIGTPRHKEIVTQYGENDQLFKTTFANACGHCALADTCQLASRPDLFAGNYDSHGAFYGAPDRAKLKRALEVSPTVKCDTVVTAKRSKQPRRRAS